MIVALYIFIALVCVGFVLKLTDRGHNSEPELSSTEPVTECCGLHEVCEKIATNDGIEYFDDEELDEFAGRAPESYSAEETELFRDVLLTLRPSEAAEWAHSIEQRGISLPADIRDELLIILQEI